MGSRFSYGSYWVSGADQEISVDKQMRDFVASKIKPMNPDLANGLAFKQLADAHNYVERDFKSSAEYYKAPVHFIQLRRLTPMEEYRALHPRKEKNFIELSRTDTTLAEAIFEHNGKLLEPRPIAIPFCRRGNLFWLQGSEYQVSPVIEDAAVSVTRGGLFVWLGMTKANFSRFGYHVRVDTSDYTANVAFSLLYHTGERSKAVKPGKNSPRPTLMHYIMCRFGFTETMKRFFDVTDIAVGTSETITQENYDPEHWSIIRSFDGNAFKRKEYKKPTDIRVAILRAQATPAVLDAICSFFYVVDLFPDMVFDYDVEKPAMWKRLLGIIWFTEKWPEGDRMKWIDSHMSTIEGYINYQSRRNLSQGGIEISDIFEFLAWVIYNLPSKVSTSNGDVASLYGKRLTVTRYLLKDISRAIYTLMYALNNRYENRKGRLSERDVREILRKGLPRDKILDASSGHAEVTTVSYPGSCMIYDITSTAVLQENTDNAPGKHGGGVNDPSKVIHSSVLAFGNYVAMGKNEPSGRSKLGMHTQLGPRGELLEDPENKNMLMKLDMQLTRL